MISNTETQYIKKKIQSLKSGVLYEKAEGRGYSVFLCPLISQYPTAEALGQLQVTTIHSQNTVGESNNSLVDALGY